MAQLAVLADIQQTVYTDEVTRQPHVMAQVRESSPVTKYKIRRSLAIGHVFGARYYIRYKLTAH